MNVSILVASLKFVNANIKTIVYLSTWINKELVCQQVTDIKIKRALKQNDRPVIFELISLVKDIRWFADYIKRNYIKHEYNINLDIVVIMIELGADVDNDIFEDMFRYKCLHNTIKLLISREHVITRNALFQAIINKNTELIILAMNIIVHITEEYILSICKHGDIDTLKYLLQKDYKLDNIDIKQLIYDTNGNINTKVLKLLIDVGNRYDNCFEEVLGIAIFKQDKELASLLIMTDNRINNFEKMRPAIKYLIQIKDTDILELLIQKNNDIKPLISSIIIEEERTQRLKSNRFKEYIHSTWLYDFSQLMIWILQHKDKPYR